MHTYSHDREAPPQERKRFRAATLPNSTFPTDHPLCIPDSPRPVFLLAFAPPLPSSFHSFSLSLPVPRPAFSESGREKASPRWQNQLSRDPPHFCFIYFYTLVYCVVFLVYFFFFFVPMTMELSIFFGLLCLCSRIFIFLSFMLEWGCLIYVAAGNQFYTFPFSLFLHPSRPLLFPPLLSRLPSALASLCHNYLAVFSLASFAISPRVHQIK